MSGERESALAFCGCRAECTWHCSGMHLLFLDRHAAIVRHTTAVRFLNSAAWSSRCQFLNLLPDTDRGRTAAAVAPTHALASYRLRLGAPPGSAPPVSYAYAGVLSSEDVYRMSFFDDRVMCVRRGPPSPQCGDARVESAHRIWGKRLPKTESASGNFYRRCFKSPARRESFA